MCSMGGGREQATRAVPVRALSEARGCFSQPTWPDVTLLVTASAYPLLGSAHLVPSSGR